MLDLSTDLREAQRLEKLNALGILDTPQDHEFDTIVTLGQHLLDMPMVLVSLVDDHRQWFKAKCGITIDETSRDVSFCTHALDEQDVMIVPDATRDPRFADNPFVTGEPHIRFYAGVPLRPAAEGFDADLPAVGTLCVLDVRPRELSEDQLRMLRELAGLVSALIRARASAATARRLSITAHEHAKMLERQHVQLRQAERIAGIGSWRWDIAEQRIEWSDQVYAIHGLPIGQMPTMEEALSFYPPARRSEIATMLERSATRGESFDFESDFVTADGQLRRVRSMGEAQLANGRPVSLIGVFQDVTDRHQREQVLRQSADTDALTGLANRACFEHRLKKLVDAAPDSRRPACLLLLDLDGFKGVNDTFGHGEGDEVLRVMAERLKRFAYSNSFVARLGGDEFVMLLTRPRDCAAAEAVISEMLSALRHSVERDGKRRSVSATIGAAFLDGSIVEPSELTRRADVALYEAKRDHRGTARIFGQDGVLRPRFVPRMVA